MSNTRGIGKRKGTGILAHHTTGAQALKMTYMRKTTRSASCNLFIQLYGGVGG